jgi:hypothetical protein
MGGSTMFVIVALAINIEQNKHYETSHFIINGIFSTVPACNGAG